MPRIKELLKGKSAANMVEYGYGQVEPNHLSAQRNGQIYAQLPTDKEIKVLEQGQFVKYDYAKKMVDFDGAGEWMLVYNETKLYRDEQHDCEFAMVDDLYKARVYSPFDGEAPKRIGALRDYTDIIVPEGSDVGNLRSWDYTEDPANVFTVHSDLYDYEKMGEATNSMVPRVFKTMPGDIFTTNTINLAALANIENITDEQRKAAFAALGLETVLVVGKEDGILTDDATQVRQGDTMRWQVVKKYDMPDGQVAIKVMRIA